jgi:hypothetical protein
MKNTEILLTTTLLILSGLTPLLALAPSVNASGGYNWQIAVSGKGILHPGVDDLGGNLNFKVEGWCAFTGVSSGTAGDCSLNRYVHSASGDLSCETTFDITEWHTAQALMGPFVDFYIDAGTVTVSPASATTACAELLLVAGGYHVAATGTPGILTFSAPTDTHFPATPGHYTSGGGPVTWAVFNLQVMEIPS